MPMLITLRIGLPVWPFQSPERTRSRERRHPVEHLMDLLDDVLAVDDQRAVLRHPQRHVEDGPVLGDVDVLAAEHRVAPLGDAASAGELDEQPERLVGDAVLRIVQEETGALGDQPLAAIRILGEEVAQVPLPDLGVVLLESLPGRLLPEGRLAVAALMSRKPIRLDPILHSIYCLAMDAAATLRSARRKSGLSQTELARRAGTSRHLLGVRRRLEGARPLGRSSGCWRRPGTGSTSARNGNSAAVGQGDRRRGRVLAQVLSLAEVLPAKRRSPPVSELIPFSRGPLIAEELTLAIGSSPYTRSSREAESSTPSTVRSPLPTGRRSRVGLATSTSTSLFRPATRGRRSRHSRTDLEARGTTETIERDGQIRLWWDDVRSISSSTSCRSTAMPPSTARPSLRG